MIKLKIINGILQGSKYSYYVHFFPTELISMQKILNVGNCW